MRYWGILAAKLVVATAVLYAIWYGLSFSYSLLYYVMRWKYSPHDLNATTIVFFYNLLVQGVLFLIVWDQRYRCRTCGRRLRMPIQTGRYAQQLLYGRPKLEYICIYGHGTLRVPELHIASKEPVDWQPHDDMWKELYSFDKTPKE